VFVNVGVFCLAFFLDFFEIAFIVLPLIAPIAHKTGIEMAVDGASRGQSADLIHASAVRHCALQLKERDAAEGQDRRHLFGCRAVSAHPGAYGRDTDLRPGDGHQDGHDTSGH
jgi:hypothetical protein